MKSIFIFLISILLISFTAEAGNARRPVFAKDMTMIVDADNGKAADVDENYEAVKVLNAGSDSTQYANADETVVSTGCVVSAISFFADTAGEDVLIYDGNGANKILKYRIANGTANSSVVQSFPAGLRFNDDIYVDVDAGDEVYFVYTAE